LAGTEKYDRRALSDVRYIVLHHSGVAGDQSAATIANYHVQSNGWPGIGYHYLVHPDGLIEYVGDVLTVRYNVASRNKECIGVCLPGDFTSIPPTDQQLAAARALVRFLQGVVPAASVVGHGDIALPGWETSCPGATWPGWRQRVEAG